MIRTFFISGFLFLIATLVTGCKDVIQQPLTGSYELEGQDTTRSIVGTWSAEGEIGAVELEISLDARIESFKLSLIEDGERYSGEATIAYYKDKIIFSINLQTLSLEDIEGIKSIFYFSNQGYALVSAYFVDESLYMIPANMEAFNNKMFEHFLVSGKLLGSCSGGSESIRILCDLLFSDSKLLALNETKEFMEAISNGFHKIFPQEDAVIFIQKGEGGGQACTGGGRESGLPN